MSANNLCLSLTLDYELFGSGQGDVFKHMIEPTNRLLALCERMGVRLTIFFEVVEYWRLKEMYESGITMGYRENPATAIEKQIVEAFRQGHDVQLHVHPQWIDARFENGSWKLNMKYWRLPEVPLVADENISMGLDQLIGKGQNTMETLLKPVDPNYQCNIIRAGGYNADPSADLLKVLRKYNFVADSSVVYGAVMDTPLSRYDYSNVSESIPYWFSNGTSLLETNTESRSVLELPVFALSIRRITKYDLVRVRTVLKNRPFARERFKSNSAGMSKWETIQYFLDREAVTWDYCLFSSGKMRKFIQKAGQIATQSDFEFHPFVLVGHPKDFFYSDALHTLIRYSRKYGGEFMTLSGLVQRIKRDQYK
jgi:hypothetical protein